MSREYDCAVDTEELENPAEVIRARWRELAALADDARELSLFCLMLLEELYIARGLLLHTDSPPLPSSSAAGDLGFRASRSEVKSQLESYWLDQFQSSDGMSQLRLVFERLLDDYIQARLHSNSR